ncbi:MAG: phosphoribosylamine--glycine ligase [Candidatus Marinimicrobia bacterium]|mgnify:CR=1 FL=1|jgi:phosphoribosylamine--glycine ligase|nr:phosphoribosylamine--glycine ligase [Candidatus Neomarinimicrobiota bacterium]MDP6456179.1 phosphoribosylamine--glycine ligase [Candidatus Neomarinimicrobiota bacterium]MDP6592817.1 phosphoribosylamine--glycine ligase [Candidatus Neomarinimicrobiota bacterium]MDP6836072.1 phosphoribosylamine--glycine ligase [Candidatus Neomarinimicrobiota bacterium]MDP6965703.1 phosphoribosylamine--glycine ligase [Candidatus Neomarinimicrobiota bacterium]|tara:strand:+ start:3316 stop:4650 length:1335 start_codon:yes stop_codon:yes gene_type:complete
MKILLIGSGAREHAIARALSRSEQNPDIICFASNNNPGIQEHSSVFAMGKISDPAAVTQFADQHSTELAIIGPEAPLEAGVADALWETGIPCVGPKKALAQIETSKGFTRDLLTKYRIPACPAYKRFSAMEGVREFLTELHDNYVVKYDGLMGGKGVKVAGDHLHSHDEALDYCMELVSRDGTFVVEEKLIGEEFSLMSFCDGEHLAHMPPVQDHKRAYDGDTGPNTGGMGSYSDADHSLPFLTDEEIAQAQKFNQATAQALKEEFGDGYKGILYGGFIATADGVKLIEYNARLGDPEAMNVLPLLQSDFMEVCMGMVNGNLDARDITFAHQATVCKYAVPKGYPDSPVKGECIDVSAITDRDQLYYASVEARAGLLYEAGSRTAAYVGIAQTLTEAETTAEVEISKVGGPLFHRKDIGTEELVQKRIDHMNELRNHPQRRTVH